ncbi:MAG: hypothetical protein KAW00_01510 [Dehalococcoidia bacterium]|nr:hypothetical protein [Dehalococcoidia bacterium]
MKNISKEVFLNALACPTLGWLLRSGQSIEQLSREALTLGEQFRMDQGIEVHNRARQLYPDGTLVQRTHIITALQETMNLMNNSNISTIFEATFLCFGVDYKKRPSLVFQQELEAKLVEVSSSHFISGGYTWFTRKNMSVYSGLRVYSPPIARIMPSLYRVLLPFFIILAPIFLVGAKIRSLFGAPSKKSQD